MSREHDADKERAQGYKKNFKTIGVGSGGILGFGVANTAAGLGLMATAKKDKTKLGTLHMLRSVAKKNNVKIEPHIISNTMGSGTANPTMLKSHIKRLEDSGHHSAAKYYKKLEKKKISQVFTSRSEAVALHEMGHVKQFNTPAKNALLHYNYHNGKILGASGLLLSGKVRDKAKDLSKHNKIVDNAMDFVEDHPEAAVYALLSPKLITEADASLFATKELIKKHGLGKGLKKAAPLSIALGTYATMNAIPAIAGGAVFRIANRKRLEEKARKRKQTEKKAEAYKDYIYKQAGLR